MIAIITTNAEQRLATVWRVDEPQLAFALFNINKNITKSKQQTCLRHGRACILLKAVGQTGRQSETCDWQQAARAASAQRSSSTHRRELLLPAHSALKTLSSSTLHARMKKVRSTVRTSKELPSRMISCLPSFATTEITVAGVIGTMPFGTLFENPSCDSTPKAPSHR